ncbi:hypothetical protein ACOMHN_058175 [Nucella lapillus]
MNFSGHVFATGVTTELEDVVKPGQGWAPPDRRRQTDSETDRQDRQWEEDCRQGPLGEEDLHGRRIAARGHQGEEDFHGRRIAARGHQGEEDRRQGPLGEEDLHGRRIAARGHQGEEDRRQGPLGEEDLHGRRIAAKGHQGEEERTYMGVGSTPRATRGRPRAAKGGGPPWEEECHQGPPGEEDLHARRIATRVRRTATGR